MRIKYYCATLKYGLIEPFPVWPWLNDKTSLLRLNLRAAAFAVIWNCAALDGANQSRTPDLRQLKLIAA